MCLGVPADFTKPGPGVLETDILNMNLQKVGSGLYVLKKTTVSQQYFLVELHIDVNKN